MKISINCLPIGLVAALFPALVQAQNLFVSDSLSSNIYEFTPGGTQSTFASGLSHPFGLAFDNAGDLFEADLGSGNIYEFTPGGTRGTFASGLLDPWALAFDSAGNLFEADSGSGNIYEFTTNGVRSTFASGLSHPGDLAFQPVPEPSTWAMLGMGAIALLGFHCQKRNHPFLRERMVRLSS